jgi:hypothetical protein
VGAFLIQSVTDTIFAMLYIRKEPAVRRVPFVVQGPQFEEHWPKLFRVYYKLGVLIENI